MDKYDYHYRKDGLTRGGFYVHVQESNSQRYIND